MFFGYGHQGNDAFTKETAMIFIMFIIALALALLFPNFILILLLIVMLICKLTERENNKTDYIHAQFEPHVHIFTGFPK